MGTKHREIAVAASAPAYCAVCSGARVVELAEVVMPGGFRLPHFPFPLRVRCPHCVGVHDDRCLPIYTYYPVRIYYPKATA